MRTVKSVKKSNKVVRNCGEAPNGKAWALRTTDPTAQFPNLPNARSPTRHNSFRFKQMKSATKKEKSANSFIEDCETHTPLHTHTHTHTHAPFSHSHTNTHLPGSQKGRYAKNASNRNTTLGNRLFILCFLEINGILVFAYFRLKSQTSVSLLH